MDEVSVVADPEPLVQLRDLASHWLHVRLAEIRNALDTWRE
jgi:hypothetical protein